VKPGEPIPETVSTKFHGKAFGAGNHTYYNVMMRIVHMPLAEIEQLEKRLSNPPEPSSVYSGSLQALLRLFDELDADHDGRVPLAEIFAALEMSKAEARQVKSLRGWDVNGDGIVTRPEAEQGVRAQLEYQTNRGMNTDADGDGALTAEEYALSYADPNGKVQENGLTEAQWKAFLSDDLDHDGKVTRREIEIRVDQGYRSSYAAQWVAMRAKRADRDGDGFLDEAEFAAITGKLDGDSRKAFGAAGAKDGKVPFRGLYLWYFRASPEERAAMEKQLESLN
jgi:Ca2+-binding EF-hand superfamily protein